MKHDFSTMQNHALKCFILFVCVLFLPACRGDAAEGRNSTASSDESLDFTGFWKWLDNEEGNHIFELVLNEQQGLYEGYYCAIFEDRDGQRIDCGYGEGRKRFNLLGTLQGEELHTSVTSPFSRESGKAIMTKQDGLLHWQLTEPPGTTYRSDYYCPPEAWLMTDNRKLLRTVSYHQKYIWETNRQQNDITKLDGKWLLTDFFDSTLINKEVFSYVDKPVVPFGCVLDFTKLNIGRVQISGTHDYMETKIERIDPTTIGFSDGLFDYRLEFQPNTDLLKLYLLEKGTPEIVQTAFYRYAPLTTSDDFGVATTGLFNQILEGKYEMLNGPDQGRQITFDSVGLVRGLDPYYTYRVHWLEEAGTPNFDAVCLQDSLKNEEHFFHFEFREEALVLFELKKTTLEDSGFFSYEIGEETWRLRPEDAME